MRKQVNRAAKKYYTLKNFFVFTILLAFVMLGIIILIETSSRLLAECKPSKMNLAGQIDPGLSEAHEFNYQGETNCYLIILPSENVKNGVSLWFYQPNGEIQVKRSVQLEHEGAIILQDVPKGTYRISVRNTNGESIKYNLALYLAAK